MNIRKEIHCARMHRRFSFPLSLSFGGQVQPLENWSQGGILVKVPENTFRTGEIETAELMIPCSDGMYSLPVQLFPLRSTVTGWACKFVDMPPREQAILKFFTEIVLRGDNVLMAELDAAGRIARNPEPRPPSTQTIPSEKEGNDRAHFRLPVKYIALVAALVAVVALLGYFIVPYVAGNILQKFSKSSNLETVAQSRVLTANLAVQDLDNKIRAVEEMLAGSSGGLSLRSEQRDALEIGLSQLRTEREMALVHLQVLETNLDLIRRGDFLIEEAVFSGYNTDARLSTAPYLGEILSDIAVGGRMFPQTEEDRRKFGRVAQARLAEARHNFQATKVKRETLEKIVERAEKAAQASAFPQNTLDLLRRDVELQRIEEQRLQDIIALLEENVEAVQQGNFTYELQLLQRFDPRTGTGVSTQEAAPVQ
jgi:hypothetical protein